MERGQHEEGIEMEWEICLVFEPEGECRGTSGRKMRCACIHCPNWQRWMERQKKDKERNEDNGDKSENVH